MSNLLSPFPAIGMNMGHYEEDLTMLDANGKIDFDKQITTHNGQQRNLLSQVEQFKVIRFMNWQKTNDFRWKDKETGETKFVWKKPPADLDEFLQRESRFTTQNRGNNSPGNELPPWQSIPASRGNARPWRNYEGVPLEACLEMANQSGANPWVCVPHGMSENGGQLQNNFAPLMRHIVDTVCNFQQTHAPDRKPVFEFSNEVWNGQFDQQRQCAEMARQHLSHLSPLAANWEAAAAWQAKCTAELADYVGERGHVVLAGQATRADYLRLLLQELDRINGLNKIDAIAIAPYYGNLRPNFDPMEHPKNVLGSANPLQTLADNLRAYIAGYHENGRWVQGEIVTAIRDHLQLCWEYSNHAQRQGTPQLQLWGYEGGQHLAYSRHYPAAQEQQIKTLFRDLNRHPLMAQLNNLLLESWFSPRSVTRSNGHSGTLTGGLICFYNFVSGYEKNNKIENQFFGHLEMQNSTYVAHQKFTSLIRRVQDFHNGLVSFDLGAMDSVSAPKLEFVSGSFKTLPASLDVSQMPAGTKFRAQWQFKSLDSTPWGQGYALVYRAVGSNGAAMTQQTSYNLPDVALFDADGLNTITLNMTVPDNVGQLYHSEWHLLKPDGTYSNKLYIDVVVSESTSGSSRWQSANSAFLRHQSVPNDMRLLAGKSFTKQWLVRNTGQRKWGNGFRLVFVEGDWAMTAGHAAHVVSDTAPNQEVVLTIPMVVPPARQQPYRSVWRLQDDRNNYFGDPLLVQIVSTGTGVAPSSMFHNHNYWYSQRDPRWRNTPFGLGNRPIGSWGCLMTCYAMMLTAFGDAATPVQLDKRLIDASGYAPNTSNVWFTAPTKVNDKIKFLGQMRFSQNLTLAQLDAALAAGKVVLAQVDSIPLNNSYDHDNEQHWVVLATRTQDGADYLIVDPIVPPNQNQHISLMAKYGNARANQTAEENLKEAILSVLVYEHQGEIPTATSTPSFTPTSAPIRTHTRAPVRPNFNWSYNRFLTGAHDRANRHPQAQDHAIVNPRFDSIKVMSGITAEEFSRYNTRSGFTLCRLFETWNGRNDMSPEKFVNAVIPDIRHLVEDGKVTHFEFHNEPNLTHEGWQAHGVNGSWTNGAEFADFFLKGRELLKREWNHIKVGFPGLSPGGNNAYSFGPDHGWRRDSETFLREAKAATDAADFICLHAYYDSMANVHNDAFQLVKQYRARFPNKLLFVTEFGNPSGENAGIPMVERGRQAKEFFRLCSTVPGVGGAYYYIVSGSGWGIQSLRDENGNSTGIVEGMFGF